MIGLFYIYGAPEIVPRHKNISSSFPVSCSSSPSSTSLPILSPSQANDGLCRSIPVVVRQRNLMIIFVTLLVMINHPVHLTQVLVFILFPIPIIFLVTKFFSDYKGLLPLISFRQCKMRLIH